MKISKQFQDTKYIVNVESIQQVYQLLISKEKLEELITIFKSLKKEIIRRFIFFFLKSENSEQNVCIYNTVKCFNSILIQLYRIII